MVGGFAPPPTPTTFPCFLAFVIPSTFCLYDKNIPSLFLGLFNLKTQFTLFFPNIYRLIFTISIKTFNFLLKFNFDNSSSGWYVLFENLKIY
jgi:hypothetical protein